MGTRKADTILTMFNGIEYFIGSFIFMCINIKDQENIYSISYIRKQTPLLYDGPVDGMSNLP